MARRRDEENDDDSGEDERPARRRSRNRDDDSDEHEMPKKKSGVPVWAWVLIAISGLGMLGCCGGLVALGIYGKSLPTVPTVPDQVYEANDLLATYKKSPAKAADDFGNKRITVRGRITNFLGDTVLMGDGGTSISCSLSHSDAAKVSVGQTVKVRGTVTLGNQGGVWLQDCKIAD